MEYRKRSTCNVVKKEEENINTFCKNILRSIKYKCVGISIIQAIIQQGKTTFILYEVHSLKWYEVFSLIKCICKYEGFCYYWCEVYYIYHTFSIILFLGIKKKKLNSSLTSTNFSTTNFYTSTNFDTTTSTNFST